MYEVGISFQVEPTVAIQELQNVLVFLQTACTGQKMENTNKYRVYCIEFGDTRGRGVYGG